METTESRERRGGRPAHAGRPPPPRGPRAAGSRPGFSFVEVLFAVMILGIGFIMTAAIFPVALSQTQATTDETAGATVARNAVAYLSVSMSADNTPATGGAVASLDSAPGLWISVGGNVIPANDRRYAWVAAYRRDEGASFAQVFVFVVRVRNRSAYEPGLDLVRHGELSGDAPAEMPATLEPRRVRVRLLDGGSGGADEVHFTEHADPHVAAVAPGSYLVTAAPGVLGEAAGRTYRVGNFKGSSEEGVVYELMPGHDLPGPAEELLDPTTALIVGRGYADPNDPSGGYEGPSQDVALYAAIVRLN